MTKKREKYRIQNIKRVLFVWLTTLLIVLSQTLNGNVGAQTPTPYSPYSPYATPIPRPGFSPFCNGVGINTAIGCIPTNDINNFLAFILRWAMGVAGGIAFLLIVYSGFLILTSVGNPQKLTAGKELLTASLAGLILLIFSVFLLDIIGVRIFRLPGMIR